MTAAVDDGNRSSPSDIINANGSLPSHDNEARWCLSIHERCAVGNGLASDETSLIPSIAVVVMAMMEKPLLVLPERDEISLRLMVIFFTISLEVITNAASS